MQKQKQKTNYSTTIAIDSERSVFHFYTMNDNDNSTIAHYVKGYTGGQFDDNFFVRFKSAVKAFAASTPSETVRKVTVVLPDSVVLTDTLHIPTMQNPAQTKKTLSQTLEGIFRNFKDLRGGSYVLDQNKQYTTFAITAVQKRIVSSIFAACSENKMLVDTLTYASGAAVAGAQILDSRLKNATFLFLDVKDVYSRLVFVSKGRPVGYYIFPFGLELLKSTSVVPEEKLFDHSYAELVIFDAKEKARAKTPGAAEDSASNALNKEARVIPKALRREIPDTQEGIRYENFRSFVKWVFNVMDGNDRLTELGKPEFICVNLPDSLADVIPKANEEYKDAGVTFNRLFSNGATTGILSNLELYGGLSPKAIATVAKI